MSYPFPCEPESLISFRRRLNFKSMIGGIGHDVQKIKVRLEELQRDVSASPCHPPPPILFNSLESISEERNSHVVTRPPVVNLYWSFRITTVASDWKRGMTDARPNDKPHLFFFSHIIWSRRPVFLVTFPHCNLVRQDCIESLVDYTNPPSPSHTLCGHRLVNYPMYTFSLFSI